MYFSELTKASVKLQRVDAAHQSTLFTGPPHEIQVGPLSTISSPMLIRGTAATNVTGSTMSLFSKIAFASVSR